MSTPRLEKPIDPAFPDYVYAEQPLVTVYKNRTQKKGVANLFLGEWMKVVDRNPAAAGRLHVRYRGGEGYVEPSAVTRKRHLEMYFIDVGQGDAILIQTPDDRRILIDGGETDDAYGFIKNKYRLDKPDNCIDFDAVVCTHSDADHSGGLLAVLGNPKIAVKRFYHNGLFRRTNSKRDPGEHKKNRVYGMIDRPDSREYPSLTALMKKLCKAVETAEKNLPVVIGKMKKCGRRVDMPRGGFVCRRLDAADGFLSPFDDPGKSLIIDVLWPRAVKDNGKLAYPWYGDAGKTVNGNSVVLCVRHGKQRILLTGDLNTASMEDLLNTITTQQGTSDVLDARVYKAAHHGSQDFSLPFLKAVKPDAAVISSGDDRNDIHGHPRAVLLGTITRYSKSAKPAIFSTELAACFSLLSKKEQAQFTSSNAQLYERSIRGIVHLRSNGEQLFLGSVHGRKAPKDPLANLMWKWDIWPEEEG